MNILLHAAELSRVKIVFNNIKNLIKENDNQSSAMRGVKHILNIKVVFNSDAVQTLIKTHDVASLDWENLTGEIELLVCQNSLNGFNIDKSKLIDSVTVVPSGIYHIATLQDKGFYYIRP